MILKQQLDTAKQKNSVLEDQVSHLNEALKECMRDLQQAKEEQEQKIHEALTNNSYGLESKKPDHEWKVEDLASSPAQGALNALPALSTQASTCTKRENMHLR